MPFYDPFRNCLGFFFREKDSKQQTFKFSVATFAVDDPLIRELVTRQERLCDIKAENGRNKVSISQKEVNPVQSNTNTSTKSTSFQQTTLTSRQSVEDKFFLFDLNLTHRGQTTVISVTPIDPEAPFILPKKSILIVNIHRIIYCFYTLIHLN
jgi:hypothetical protein